MCGRFVLGKEPDEIKDELEVETWEEEQLYLPNFNVAPTQFSPVLVHAPDRRIKMMRWGLIPVWARDASIGSRMINARSETLAQKPAFRNLISKKRCAIIAEGYYEWQKAGREKQPYFIFSAAERLMLFAGLWDCWHDHDKTRLMSFTIITQNAAENVNHIHDRMPVPLTADAVSSWLDVERCAKPEALSALRLSDHDLSFHPVSKLVNSVKNNSPQCREPISGNLL